MLLLGPDMERSLESELAVAHLTSAMVLLDQVGAAVAAAAPHVDAALGAVEAELADVGLRAPLATGNPSAHDPQSSCRGEIDQQRLISGQFH
jgi:hypothetical protein